MVPSAAHCLWQSLTKTSFFLRQSICPPHTWLSPELTLLFGANDIFYEYLNVTLQIDDTAHLPRSHRSGQLELLVAHTFDIFVQHS